VAHLEVFCFTHVYTRVMCGICGVFGSPPPNGPKVDEIVNGLKHRGPDDFAVFAVEGFSFGHTRLSIQDPENSNQPMFSHSRETMITYNGEIYNKDELRSMLPGKNWKTSGDTELLLELLEFYGVEILSSVQGMFAFGIYSFKDDELILARDQMGEKPLFYRLESSNVIFSSELRSLISSDTEISDLKIEGLAHYLKYLYFPSTAPVHSDISCLAPGHFVKFTRSGYSIGNWAEFSKNRSSSKATKNLKSTISEAVRKSLVSDVPVGIMLSGGIDSSIIAYEAAKYSDDLYTYSFVMPGHSHDSKYAELMSEKLNTHHIEIEFDEKKLAQIIEDTLSRTSQPFGDTSIIPLRMLTSRASEDVKVLLSGDGADELFSGYEYYTKYFNLERKSNNWNYHRESSSIKVQTILGQLSASQSKEMRMRLKLEYGKLSSFESWSEDISVSDSRTLRRILGLKDDRFLMKTVDSSHSSLIDVLLWDQSTYLPNDLLFKSDMGGMLSSVEIRAPFLNPDVIRHARDLDHLSMRPLKGYLKDEYRGIIPDEILDRKKQGFGAPVKKWISSGLLDDLCKVYVNDKDLKIYQVLRYKEVLNECARNPIFMWNILSLSIWVEANVPN
jgi:asparagine synthase (glutamine-hydrolysing)